ncbi:MAG: ABC transporter permease [Syntrophobacteraceae bacterium]
MTRKSIFFDILRISIHQVIMQRRRYLGVILAVALGTAGFIAIVTMGRDVKKTLNRDLDLLGGANLIMAYLDAGHKYSKMQQFQPETIDALRALPGVEAVSAIVSKPSSHSSVQRHNIGFHVVGADGFFWDVNSFTPVKGSFFNAEDISQKRRVCVLGTKLALRIFGDVDPVGRMCWIENEQYRVVGVLGGVAVGDLVDFGFIPITTAIEYIPGLPPPYKIYIRCTSWDDVKRVADAIPDVVHRHQLTDSLRIEVRWEELKRVKSMAWWVELFVYFATVSTLILGGFGIWNGMMATVKTRKAEIGLKKAIGAEDRDILAQFLVEAVCLSFTSALLGGVLGLGALEIGSYFLKSRPHDTLFLACVGLALLFSLVLGAGAGFYPSIRASHMEVVDAIRDE